MMPALKPEVVVVLEGRLVQRVVTTVEEDWRVAHAHSLLACNTN